MHVESTSASAASEPAPFGLADADQPLRIALCITELDMGGAERCLAELATRLDRHRFAPVVYALSPPPAAGARSFLPSLQAAGIETHFLEATGVRHLRAAVRRLTKLLRQQRPDLLQSFLFHANFVGRWAAWRAGVPRVLSGVRVAEQGVGWHLWLDRSTSRLVDRYVCVSRAVADFSRSRLGLPEDRFVVIPNGIDVERFAAAAPIDLTRLGLAAGRRAVTYVGRLEPQKGVAQLVEHAPSWLDRLPGHDLLMLGAGPMETELRALAERLRISSRIHFLGWRPDVAEILKAIDLLVLPSRWEGMPNVILEAMAAGRAVISTDVEGVRELLGEAASEQVVPRGDYPALAARISALAADESVLCRLGTTNQRRAQEFAWDKMVRAYEKLFVDLTDAARAGNAR